MVLAFGSAIGQSFIPAGTTHTTARLTFRSTERVSPMGPLRRISRAGWYGFDLPSGYEETLPPLPDQAPHSRCRGGLRPAVHLWDVGDLFRKS